MKIKLPRDMKEKISQVKVDCREYLIQATKRRVRQEEMQKVSETRQGKSQSETYVYCRGSRLDQAGQKRVALHAKDRRLTLVISPKVFAEELHIEKTAGPKDEKNSPSAITNSQKNFQAAKT